MGPTFFKCFLSISVNNKILFFKLIKLNISNWLSFRTHVGLKSIECCGLQYANSAINSDMSEA